MFQKLHNLGVQRAMYDQCNRSWIQAHLAEWAWPASANASTKLLVIVSRVLILLAVILWRYLFVGFHS
jgi:hypothetical protein